MSLPARKLREWAIVTYGPTVADYLSRLSPEEWLIWKSLGGMVPDHVGSSIKAEMHAEDVGERSPQCTY